MSGEWSGWSKPRRSTGVLLDRCIAAPLARDLRGINGLYVASLVDVYGPAGAMEAADEQFLAEAGRRGWMVWTQDARMAQVATQREAILANGTHVFCLGNASASSSGKGFIFGRRFLSIQKRHQRLGPCFWRLYPGQPTKKDIV